MMSADVGPHFAQLVKGDVNRMIAGLNLMTESKDLTLDEPVMHHLDRLCGVRILKSHGVVKIFSLNNQGHDSGGTENQHIYIVRPNMINMKKISDQINGDISKKLSKKYKIFMVPRKLHVAELILEQEGVYGHVSIDEIPLEFLMLDDDILSLEMNEFYRSFYLDENLTLVHLIASSLCTLQYNYGQFTNIFGQGRCAQLALKLMKELYAGPDQPSAEIGYVFLFDRDVDYVSVLMSQMTFEGMIDETFGIKNGVVQFGSEVTGEVKPVKIKLCSEDKLYEEVRDKHMSSVFHFLSNKVKTIQSSYDKRHDMSLNEMKQFVSSDLKGLKQQHQSLGMFVGASEVIMKEKKKLGFDDHMNTEHSVVEGGNHKENLLYIEEAINRQFSIMSTLRLMCLLSITQDGLSSKDYKSLVSQFCQSHGYNYIQAFHKLKKLGLFAEVDSFQYSGVSKLADKVAEAVASSLPRRSNFRAIAKKLNLVPKIDSNYDLKNPSDMAYVYSGAYTPIIPRLVEHVINRKGFLGVDEVMKMFPGSTISQSNTPQSISPPPVALVYFLGGVTRSEIASLRLIARMKGWKILIVTTSFHTGSSLLKSVI